MASNFGRTRSATRESGKLVGSEVSNFWYHLIRHAKTGVVAQYGAKLCQCM